MLTKVLPHQLDAELIEYFHGAIATDEHCGGVDLVSNGIYDNHLELWTWITNKSKMVIITEVKHYPDGYKELLICMLSGDGGVEDWDLCTNAYAGKICIDRDCGRVVAFVKADLWEIFKKAGVGEGVEEIYMVIGKEPNK